MIKISKTRFIQAMLESHFQQLIKETLLGFKYVNCLEILKQENFLFYFVLNTVIELKIKTVKIKLLRKLLHFKLTLTQTHRQMQLPFFFLYMKYYFF